MDQTRTDSVDLAARYGTHRPVRRIAGLALIVVVAGAALGWLAWAAWFHADPEVQAEVAAYDVKDAHRVDVTIQTRVRDRSAKGSCLLRASAADHTFVGERTVTIRGTSDERERVVSVRTEREATTVEVANCTAG